MKKILYDSLASALGCFCVLLLLQPFGIDQIEEGRLFFIICESLLVFPVCFIGSYVAYRLFPYKGGHNISDIARGQIPGFLVIIPLMSLVLCLFSLYFNTHSWTKVWEWFSVRGYLIMCLQVGGISFLIFVWNIYRIRNSFLRSELEEAKAINALLDERQSRLEQQSEQAEDTSEEAQKGTISEPRRFVLTGNANNAILEVCPEEILYVESMSNYADICYLEAGTLQHRTLRITMKQLRDALADVTCLVACHRAFIVNLNFVTGLSLRPTGGYQLDLLGVEKSIPVSRSNTEMLKERLKA